MQLPYGNAGYFASQYSLTNPCFIFEKYDPYECMKDFNWKIIMG